METKKSETMKNINSFQDLRARKKVVDEEIASAAQKVTRSTEDLLEEGAKVVAVGFVAFLISRLLNVFMGSRKAPPEDVAHMSNTATKSEKESKSGKSDEGQKQSHYDEAHRNGQHSNLDTALIWLETISGGIEAAKIIIGQIAEVKEQANDKSSSERSKEESTTG